MHYDVPFVEPDTPISELLVTSAESHLPLPVVENGRLIGVIPRVKLLMALGETPSVNNIESNKEGATDSGTVEEKRGEED